MAPTDYDAPRRTESDDVAEDSLDELTKRRNDAGAAVVDVDETDTAESFELPGADLSGEELSVRVVPKQADEFTCSTCFLVHHRHRAAGERALSTQACRSAATARHNRTSPSLAASAAGVNHFSELEWASTGLSAMMGRISVLLGEHGRG